MSSLLYYEMNKKYMLLGNSHLKGFHLKLIIKH